MKVIGRFNMEVTLRLYAFSVTAWFLGRDSPRWDGSTR